VEDAEAQSEPIKKVLDFLAIDRFTGGGRDGAKFDAFASWNPSFTIISRQSPTLGIGLAHARFARFG
jgi:hypothetical protein